MLLDFKPYWLSSMLDTLLWIIKHWPLIVSPSFMIKKEWICSELCSTEINCYALTTDIWTSCRNDTYTGVTVHFVNTVKCLLTKSVVSPGAQQCCGTTACTVLNDWKQSEDNLSTVATDNSSNIVAVCDITRWLRMPCFSLTLLIAVCREQW